MTADTAPDLLADAAYGAILRQCRADPGEDLHRLALADRLEELGHAYAARRVRAEVALPTPHACEGQWVGTWWEGMPPLPRLSGVNAFYVTRRGLVEQVRCTLKEWIEHGAAVVSHPLAAVAAVTLTDREPYLADDSLGAGWGWRATYRGADGRSGPRHLIPSPVLDLLPDAPLVCRGGIRHRWPTRQAALDAVSVAAIRWAELPF